MRIIPSAKAVCVWGHFRRHYSANTSTRCSSWCTEIYLGHGRTDGRRIVEAFELLYLVVIVELPEAPSKKHNARNTTSRRKVFKDQKEGQGKARQGRERTNTLSSRAESNYDVRKTIRAAQGKLIYGKLEHSNFFVEHKHFSFHNFSALMVCVFSYSCFKLSMTPQHIHQHTMRQHRQTTRDRQGQCFH